MGQPRAVGLARKTRLAWYGREGAQCGGVESGSVKGWGDRCAAPSGRCAAPSQVDDGEGVFLGGRCAGTGW